MDEELTRAVEEKSHVIGSKHKLPMPRVGSGKGSPLKPRKVHVSRRQQRVREKRGFDLSEFGRERRVAHQKDKPSTSTAGDKTLNKSTSPPPETPPPETPPPTAQETPPPTAQEAPASPPVQQTSSPTPLSPAAPVAAESPIPFKDNGPLSLQIRDDSQLLAAMSQDGETSSLGSDVSDQATDDELGLFEREIEKWQRVESRIEYAIRDTWYEISKNTTPDPRDSEILETLVTLHNMSNAVANSMAHLKGYLVQQCHQRENWGKELEITRDEISSGIRAAEYSEYISLITQCARGDCQECTEVLEFDGAYNRYDELFSLLSLTAGNGILHLFPDCGVDSLPLLLVIPRLEGGVGNSAGLTATTLHTCFDEVGVAVSTISIFCDDEEVTVAAAFDVFSDNVVFGVAIVPSSSSELPSSL
ncbi:Hypothetical predicted protein [Paramuricea clavata]|uniref:Uncharacterized protein n=1 Tax=Paramuricea clavata TaxID=317549 RepID=A0A7D9HT58_PARCT|nr:Hypothetical predicted protein [Paramuricea clavata]